MPKKNPAPQSVTQIKLSQKTKPAQGTIMYSGAQFEKLMAHIIEIKSLLKEIKEAMLTKEDGQKIIDQIDVIARKFETYTRNTIDGDARLNDEKTRVVH